MKTTILSLLLTFATSVIWAQKTDARYDQAKEVFPFGVVERIDSKALSEERVLNIYLPQGYHPDSSQTYPVVYVLDGSAHEDFPHIAGLMQFLNMYALAPKSIVVGIANVDRYRDFTFPSEDKGDQKSLPTSGGAAAFMAFVEEEVLPLVAERYPLNGESTLIGQSLGGLMTTEFLMKKPALFSQYIIVSPSLWWNKKALVKTAKQYFKTHQEIEAKVFVSLGKEHPVMHKVADELVESIQNSGNEKLSVHYQPILTEDHATILHKAVYAGFEWLYPKEEEDK
ncbi:MAG: alpha/beta hydrolase-fold protein [Bacteroidota bacterium]